MPDNDKPGEIMADMAEVCARCPFHSGIAEGLKMTKEKVACLERKARAEQEVARNEHDTLRNYIRGRLSSKTFWTVIVISVGVILAVLGFQWNALSGYQVSHTTVHRELNYELKEMNKESRAANKELTEKVGKISQDVSVIKALAEKNGDK